ncbi:MAG: hypothetical protein ACK5PP_10165 [Acidimicrobiales bacterium]
MTNLPPSSDGWIDGSGRYQPGTPPPGFWQASDGRWYPPSASSAQTQAVPPGAPGPSSPPPTGPPQQPQQPQWSSPQPAYGGGYSTPSPGSQPNKSRTPLLIALGIGGAIILLGAILAAVSLTDNDETAGSTTVSTADPSGGGGESTTVPGGEVTTAPGQVTTTPTTTPVSGGTGDLTVSCTRDVEAETITLDFTNTSDQTMDYRMTIVYRDDAGARVGDDTEYVAGVKPGQVVSELGHTFEEPGTTCEVADASADITDPERIANLGDVTCTVVGEDFVGDVDAEIQITNSGSATSDFSVDIAILDANGVRLGTGFGGASAVAPGETAPSTTLTVVPYDPSYTCEPIGISSY